MHTGPGGQERSDRGVNTEARSTEARSDEPVRLTKPQRRAFRGSFGGWAMDGFNCSYPFLLVLAPTMVALLPRAGIEPTAANIGWYGQISAAIFLLGSRVARQSGGRSPNPDRDACLP